MSSPNEIAEQIFEVLSFSIKQACDEQDWFNVSRDALAYGFKQSDVSTAFAYSQRFDLLIEPDIYLCLLYRSFDPSGPFITLPAISRFELSLSQGNTVIKSYLNGFDEPISLKDKGAWNELSFT